MSVWRQNVSGEARKYEKCPPGTHGAVMVALIDLGHQIQDGANGRFWSRKVYCVWELPDLLVSGTRNQHHVVGKEFYPSLEGPKSLMRQFVEGRLGRKLPEGVEYDLTHELGQPCLLTVTSNAAGYPQVDKTDPPPDGFKINNSLNFRPFAVSIDDYKAGRASVPTWLPRIYGREVADVMGESKQMQGDVLKGDQAAGRERAARQSANHAPVSERDDSPAPGFESGAGDDGSIPF